MKNDSKFFANTECEYYPCHRYEGDFNCLFCYCPFYEYLNCGGNWTLLPDGTKDCSDCILPHVPESYQEIVERLHNVKKAYRRI